MFSIRSSLALIPLFVWLSPVGCAPSDISSADRGDDAGTRPGAHTNGADGTSVLPFSPSNFDFGQHFGGNLEELKPWRIDGNEDCLFVSTDFSDELSGKGEGRLTKRVSQSGSHLQLDVAVVSDFTLAENATAYSCGAPPLVIVALGQVEISGQLLANDPMLSTSAVSGAFGRNTDESGAGTGGGAGRIRINTTDGKASTSGVISPARTTSCASVGVLASRR